MANFLTDLFTGAPAIDAADKNKALLNQTQAGIADRTQATKVMAGGLLSQGYGNAAGNLGTGYGAATGAINTGAGGALDYLNQGTQGAVGALQANGGAYAPLSALATQYGQGAGLYADSLGINGAEGNTRALGAYQQGPGYQASLDSGIDAINRRANAGGMLVGGNANRDAIQFAHDLSNKDYGSWQDRLSGYNNLQLGATQGAAAGNQGNNAAVAQLLNSGGINKAGVASGQGGSLADLATRYYGSLAGNNVALGGGMAGLETGANQTITGSELNIAPQITKQTTDAAAAELQGSKNMWGMGMAAAQMAMGMPPTAMGSMGTPGGGTPSAQVPSQSFMNNQWGW